MFLKNVELRCCVLPGCSKDFCIRFLFPVRRRYKSNFFRSCRVKKKERESNVDSLFGTDLRYRERARNSQLQLSDVAEHRSPLHLHLGREYSQDLRHRNTAGHASRHAATPICAQIISIVTAYKKKTPTPEGRCQTIIIGLSSVPLHRRRCFGQSGIPVGASLVAVSLSKQIRMHQKKIRRGPRGETSMEAARDEQRDSRE